MATTDKRVRILDKKVLGLIELGTRFLDLLLKASRDGSVAVFPRRGLFTGCTISGPAADKFTLTKVYGTDGTGKIALLQSADSLITAVPFENTVATPYGIGCHLAEAPDEVEVNVRTGAAQYPDLKEYVGRLGTPDSLVDNGDGTLTFRVDSVTEAAVTNAGRTVRVWKNVAASSDPAVAFEQLTVAWSGGQNKITTAHAFGQLGAASVIAGDYSVMLLGPRVSKNTDLTGVAGCIYVGSVTGAGAGVAPSVFSTASQYVYPDLQTLVDDVLEQDAHGKWRVCVKADGADVKTPQISVKDSTGARRFWLDEQGRFHHQAEAGGANGIPFGGAATGSTATTQDNAMDVLLPGNILGSLNRVADHERMLGYVMGAAILSGCAVTDVGGLFVQVATGTTAGVGRLAIQTPAIVIELPNNTASYITFDGHSFFTATTAPPVDEAPVAWILTGAGAIQQIVDLRLIPATMDRRTDLHVGGPDAHFATLGAAVKFVNHLCKPGTGAPSRTWRILVRGHTVEPDTIQFTTGNVLIEGAGADASSTTGAARLSWSGDKPLFDLNGQTDLCFRGLGIAYDFATISAVAVSRVVFDNVSAVQFQRLHIERVRIVKVGAGRIHGYMRTAGGGGGGGVFIRDCDWSGATEFGISLTAHDFHLNDCTIAGENGTQAPATAGSSGGLVLTLTNSYIGNVHLSGWGNNGVVLSGCDGVRVRDCDVHAATVNGTTTKIRGFAIIGSSVRVWLNNVRTWTLGALGCDATGIEVSGASTRVHLQDCDAAVDVMVAAPIGISLAADASFCHVDNCQTNAQGLTNLGAGNSIGAGNRDDA